jgi:drug/metabolite transporter (DMT)-like permease
LRFKGAFLVTVFALFTAGKEVVAGNLVQAADPSLVVFVAFVVTASFFHLCNAIGRAGPARTGPTRAGPGELRDLAVVNLASAGAWGILFYALQYIEPAVVSAIIAAVGPLLTIVSYAMVRSGDRVLASDVWTGAGILAAVLLLIWTTGTGEAIAPGAGAFAVWSSLAACLVSGAAVVATTVYSKRLYLAGWTPARLMAHRFYLLILLALADMVWRGVDPGQQLAQHWPVIVTMAVAGIALPIYILQFGIKLSSPVEVAVIIAMTPVFILVFQNFDDRLAFNLASVAGVGLVTFFVIANIYMRRHLHAR